MGLRMTLLTLGMVLPALALPSSGAPADAGKKPSAPAAKPGEPVIFARQIAPFLRNYCTHCHGGQRPRAGLALDVYPDEASALKDQGVWEQVAKKIKAGEMPPKDKRRPAPAEVALLTRWVDSRFAGLDCTLRKDPGRVTIRRLNRTEYNNTIRDLVGIEFNPADDFPADDVGYGFDNIGDVLSLPPLLMEKYLAAAEKIVTVAFQKPTTRQRIMICQLAKNHEMECTRKILEHFASRAYRRPATPHEVDRLVALVQRARAQGDRCERGIQVALEAVLVSPHFLFRIELDRGRGAWSNHPISDYELASRLSYFLWSSMPDDELFALARKGQLRKDLEAQVRRMLKDPRAHALVENFAGQWLELRNLKTVNPNPAQFRDFNEALRADMRRETEMFFEAVMKEDRSIFDFIEADFTFMNERLARHYGIPGIKGQQFRRVNLRGTPRGGVLTMASILTVTSNPTRTSPVKRGKWILDNILGTPPPPPPPDAGTLREDQAAVLSGSLRKRMEQHRAKAICAACHARMDPLGFGFENFDAVGGWRQRDGQFPIDSSGVLPDGQAFHGPQELKVILKHKSDLFRRCLTQKMLTYALGRGLESYDRCAVNHIADFVARNRDTFSSLVIAIVKSDPFLMRRGKGGNQ